MCRRRILTPIPHLPREHSELTPLWAKGVWALAVRSSLTLQPESAVTSHNFGHQQQPPRNPLLLGPLLSSIARLRVNIHWHCEAPVIMLPLYFHTYTLATPHLRQCGSQI
jgi:hypothetical protein